jgi:meso-butanediol dehydrogenase / (S,S)-butanediol dehydrogenase / diacetyl reductase
MMKRLESKVAIITGAGSGIGEATALLFAEEGAKVVVSDINKTGGEQTARKIKDMAGNAIFVYCDVSKFKDVENLVETSVNTYGKLDIIMNNAGYISPFACADTPLDEWDKGLSIDLNGVFYGCKYAIPAMLKNGGGSIINVSSISGLYGDYKMCWYNAAKAAVANLTRSVAIDYARDGIRCNAINPGMTITEMTKGLLDSDPRIKEAIGRDYPSGGLGTPREVANCALFLASDESSIVNGINLVCDGGLSAHSGQPDFAAIEKYMSRKYVEKHQ